MPTLRCARIPGAVTPNIPGRKTRLPPRLSRAPKNALLADPPADQAYRHRLEVDIANGDVLACRCSELFTGHFFQHDLMVPGCAVLETVCQYPERLALLPGNQR